MKLRPFAVLALLTTLAACNPTLPPPPPGWNLELRAGTTNIDRSFFQNTKPDATRSSVDQTRFAQLREAIVQKVPNFNLGSALASGFVINSKASTTNTRETAGLALSLFMAVSKDGAAPKSDLSFVYSGPTGAYDKPVTYPANNAWIASPLVIPKGNGQYTFSSTLQDGTLAGNVSVNLEDQTQWLPFAQQVSNSNPFASSMAQYGNVFIANWQPVPGAQSYLGLIFDRADKKYVGTFLTTGTRIESQDFVSVQDHVYSLDLIATTIDLTKDNTKPYGALPGSMQSSIFSFGLNNYGGTPNLFIEQARVNVLAKPNQVGEAILKIKNTGTSPLGYTATISGTGLELSTNTKSIVLYDETRELHIKGTCSNADLTGTVTLTTNDPNNKTKVIPVTLECDLPISTTLELAKLTHHQDIRFMQFSPDGTKLATLDGGDTIIIWEALTGKFIQRIKPLVTPNSYSGTVAGLAWHPNSHLLAVGGIDSVNIFDTTTGLSVVTASPSGMIQSIDWNTDGSQFVVGANNAAQIYDGSSGGLIRRIEVPNYDAPYIPVKVTWSKASSKLATSAGDQITIWDTATVTEINHIKGIISPYLGANSTTWNPAGDTLAFRMSDGVNIGIWMVTNAGLDRSIPIALPSENPNELTNIGELKWNPTGSDIALIVRKSPLITGPNLIARIWNASNGNFQKEFSVSTISRQPVPSLEWSIDGKFLLTQENLVAISWDAQTGTRGVQFGFVQGLISSISLNTYGSQLLVATNRNYSNNDYVGTLNLMDVPSGNVLQSFDIAKRITSVGWRKDTTQVLAVLDSGGIVQSYTSGSWNPSNTYEGYNPTAYSPDGTKIAVSLNDLRFRILNTSTGAVLQTITTCGGCDSYVKQSLVWSPDSSKIAVVGDSSGKLQVYDAASGNLVWEKDGNLSSYFGAYLLWSPDGKRISIGSQFFDAITGAPIEVFDLSPPDGQIPTPLAWSPDSRYLLTKKSGLIELRNANTGRKVLSVLEIPSQGYGMMSPKVVVNWNAQSNRFAFTDGGSSVYIYKFSQP